MSRFKRPQRHQIIAALVLLVPSYLLGFLVGYHVLTGRYHVGPLPFWGVLRLAPFWGWVETTLIIGAITYFSLWGMYNEAARQARGEDKQGCRFVLYFLGILTVIISLLTMLLSPYKTSCVLPVLVVFLASAAYLKRKLAP